VKKIFLRCLLTLFFVPTESHTKENVGKEIKHGVEKAGHAIEKGVKELTGKKNPLEEIKELVEKLPKEIEKLLETMDSSYKEVTALEGKSGTEDVQELNGFESEIDNTINKLKAMEEEFLANPIANELKQVAGICDTPEIMALAMLPEGGGAAALVCGKAKSGHSMFVGIGAKMTAIINKAVLVKMDLSRKLDALEAKAGDSIEETAGSVKGTISKTSAVAKK
jgi:hypothetical protein